MKYSQKYTVDIINKRKYFPSLSALSHVHCCLATMIYESVEDKGEYNNYDIFSESYLIVDFDKLSHNIIDSPNNTKKSLDFGFAIIGNNIDEQFVVGDFKLNKKSPSNPYRDLLEKLKNTDDYIKTLGLSRFKSVFIIYPNELIEDVNEIALRNINRRKQAGDNSIHELEQFEFLSLKGMKTKFFD